MRSIFAALLGLTVLAAGANSADEFPPATRDRAEAATVKVTNDDDDKTGSGVVIIKTKTLAYVLTVCHIVPKAKMVEVRVAGRGGNPGKVLPAEVLARSPESDLAILRLGSDGVPGALSLAPLKAESKRAASVGWENGAAPVALDEKIKGKVNLRRPGATRTVACWETERKQAAGRSGGPLVDESGRVIGLASGHDGAAGYYVHADEVHAFLKGNGLKWILEEDR